MIPLSITLVTACVLGLMFVWLSARVIKGRVTGNVLIGNGEEDLLYRVRTHGNFTEYVPLFLILLALVEGMGGHRLTLMLLAGLFIVVRVLHVFGMASDANLKLRQLGIAGSFTCIIVMSFYGLYLGLL